jgi:2-methylcitrate dehydratase PrpD
MGVRLKFYSCVGSTHSTLDALGELRELRPFRADEVERIVVHGSQVTVEPVGTTSVPGCAASNPLFSSSAASLRLAAAATVEAGRQRAGPADARIRSGSG